MQTLLWLLFYVLQCRSGFRLVNRTGQQENRRPIAHHQAPQSLHGLRIGLEALLAQGDVFQALFTRLLITLTADDAPAALQGHSCLYDTATNPM